MVVLTTRNEEALKSLESEITREGGRAKAIPADVAGWSQVQRVAQETVEAFGRIDTWVNNAAVGVYGTFKQVPVEEFRRVMDVNLMGQVHGAKAALRHLQREGGAHIGVGAASAGYPMPLQSAYTASAWALKGFYDTLRLEQQHERSGVQVSLVLPSATDTPFFDHAKSHLGVKPGPLPPVYEAGTVANAIVYAAHRPLRDLNVGPGGILALAEEVWPRAADAHLERVAFSGQLTYQPETPSSLWEPVAGPGAVGGGYRSLPGEPFSWLQTHPGVRNAVTGVALSGVVLPVLGLALAGLAIPAAGFVLSRRGVRLVSRFAGSARQAHQRRGFLPEVANLGVGGAVPGFLRPVPGLLLRQL